MVAVTISVMAYLKFVHGWDTLSALFAAAPGALAQAMALAQDTGANVRAIAMVQTVRLFILAVALPLSSRRSASPACRRRAAATRR